jgi:hypothetical protein
MIHNIIARGKDSGGGGAGGDTLIWFENGVFNTDVFGEPNKSTWVTITTDGKITFGKGYSLKSTVSVDATPFSTFQYDILEKGYCSIDVSIVSEQGVKLASTGQYQNVGTITLDISHINEPIFIHMTGYANSDSDYVRFGNMKLVP